MYCQTTATGGPEKIKLNLSKSLRLFISFFNRNLIQQLTENQYVLDAQNHNSVPNF